MTTKQRDNIECRLVHQLSIAVDRILQLEKENFHGLPHTALREQINSLCKFIDDLKEVRPFNHLSFQTKFAFGSYSELKEKLRKQCAWFGYL